MSDNDKSGAPSAPGFGAFGSARGSGLARGKRPAQPAPSTAAATPAGYTPTALEVIRPASEYKNPFTGETTVPSAPARPEPVERVVNEPAPQAAPSVTSKHQHIDPIGEAEKPFSPPVPVAAESRPAPAAAAPAEPLFPFEGEEKAELKILPPETAKRPAVSWEAPGANPAAEQPAAPQRRDERPTFRTERSERRDAGRGEGRSPEGRSPEGRGEGREPRSFEPRQPRDPRDERQPRDPRDERQPRDPRDERKFEPRANQPYRERTAQPAPAPAKKSGGFLGWLKGLFGGGAAPAAPATGGGQRDGEPRREGDREQGGQRRHRGGRGRGYGGGGGGGQGGGFRDENRGPRPEGQAGGGEGRGEGRGFGGEGRGEGDGGQRRRRRRGGRGRFRGEGGGDGRGPRPEGQQGGGAI